MSMKQDNQNNDGQAEQLPRDKYRVVLTSVGVRAVNTFIVMSKEKKLYLKCNENHSYVVKYVQF